MKKSIVIVAVIGCMSLHFPASAQTTVLSDTFTSDSSLAQPPWYNLNNTSDANYALNPTAGQGLALTVSPSTETGKVNEMFAGFNSVTLSDGEYITLTVDFNSPSGMSTDTGGLLVGLYNGTAATGNEQGSSGSTATGGQTAAYQGYFGIMGYNTSAGTSSKFYSRQGGASDANELGYYSEMTSGSYTQLSSTPASGNANLGLNINYTLTYTITDNGASGNQIVADIYNSSNLGAPLDSWTTTDSTGLYDTFNELDFGNYGKAGAVDINILSESVETTAPVPEPSIFTLAGAGLGLLGLMRFRRR